MTSTDAATKERSTLLRRALLKWYRKSQRELPWRSANPQVTSPDPYHVLVSEAMLQQTQVATVIDYFKRFMDTFPTIEALGDADEQQVLRQWQGLGYYRRARNLHAAAKCIVDEHDGQVPDNAVALQTLPGIGRYTAGAIASIAFGQRSPIVDGNVARVLARWFAIRKPIDDRNTRARLWSLAEQLMPLKRRGMIHGEFNQAMMELGATVCSPRDPQCGACPVKGICDAHNIGKARSLPVTAPRRKPKAVQHDVIAIERNGTFLFEQRPARGLWSNMWQLPTTEQKVDSLQRWANQRFGLGIEKPCKIGDFRHQTTHRTISFTVWHTRTKSGRLKCGSGKWRSSNSVDDLPLARPQQTALGMITNDQSG